LGQVLPVLDSKTWSGAHLEVSPTAVPRDSRQHWACGRSLCLPAEAEDQGLLGRRSWCGWGYGKSQLRRWWRLT